MKTLIYTGPTKLEIQEVANPVPSTGEVLIKVAACGICGSDMHAYLGHDERRPAPLILGHEVAGTIVDGNGTDWSNGDRVTVNPLVSCGTCSACERGDNNLCPDRQIISMPPREGGFAEYLTMRAANLVKVPEHVSFEKAALAEPIACGWHAVRLGLEKITGPDQRAMVIGGGAIGVGVALSLSAQGVSDITVAETNPLRVRTLKDIGINVVHPDSFENENFDMVIDAVGFSATRHLASQQVRPGGVILHIGLGDSVEGLDVRRITLQEITFIGTYTYTKEDFQQTAEAIFNGKLGSLDWLDVQALTNGAEAFSNILDGKIAAPKIILTT